MICLENSSIGVKQQSLTITMTYLITDVSSEIRRNTTSTTSGAGTVSPSGAPDVTSGL
jgi:hypothetical protein